MSEQAILWLFGTVITLQVSVLGGVVLAVWKLAQTVSELSARTLRMERDIGDHDSGMRGDIHDLRSKVMPFVLLQSLDMERRHQDQDKR